MIKIDDYAEISFFKWLARNINKDIYNIEKLNLDHMSEEYLTHNCRKWDFKFFIKLFQDYLLYYQHSNESLNDAFQRFCDSSKSMEYINPISINKPSYLQDYLNRFYYYATKVYVDNMDINKNILSISRRSIKYREGLNWWFESIITEHGPLLVKCFLDFNKDFSGSYSYLRFEEWLRKSENICHITPTELNNNRYNFDFDIRKKRLIENINNKSQEEKMKLLIHNKTLGKGILSSEENMYIDFLQYITNQKGVDISKSLTLSILLEFVEMYCKEFKINKKSSLKKFAKSLNKKDGLFKSVFLLFYKDKSFNKGKNFNIERINIPKLHGMILFPKNERIDDFLNIYWQDIHYMTRDSMDIYYTEEDFKNNKSCYEKIDDLPYMVDRKNMYPAILVWHKFGDIVENIELVGLDHKDIFYVLQFIVKTIEEENDFDRCISLTKEKIKKILLNKRNDIMIDARGSQIGALGPNAMSFENTFSMGTERGNNDE